MSIKLTFRALALRQSEWRNCGLCVGIYIFNLVDITKLVSNLVGFDCTTLS